MSHRAHSKAKPRANSTNSKSKMREEEEVDELESESETMAVDSTTPAQQQHPQSERASFLDMHPQWETISSTTSSSKAGGKKIAKGHGHDKPTVKDNPHIPFARMESILHADPDGGSLSKEAIYLILCATERFIRRLSNTAHTRSKVENRAITTYKDVADTAHFFEEFNFLEDMIPRPIPVKLALTERAKKVEVNGIAPDVGGTDENSSFAMISEANAFDSAKGKGKARASAANGRGSSSKQLNGHGNAFEALPTDESISSALPRQKTKKARVSEVNGGFAPPRPSVADGVSAAIARSSSAGTNGSSGGMKIKIRARSSVAAPDRTPDTNGTINGVLPLGPPSHIKANGNSSKSVNKLMFAPPGVSDAPLWTRVPLPPPPSPKTRLSAAPAVNGNQQLSRAGSVNGSGLDFRGALSPNAPNPGRTIYSQR